ncbi:DNA polymerase III subunit beta [Candidatus Woesebacteria bacterium]|nr:DNA polymerase III subunit beta [Candidatus Woesebacteria bacterium]
MTLNIQKDTLIEKLTQASLFSSEKINTNTALRGVLLEFKGKTMQILATDLNRYFESSMPLPEETKQKKIIITTRKLLEFLQLLPSGEITISFQESTLVIKQGTKKGSFPIEQTQDFPYPPSFKKAKKLKEPQNLFEDATTVLFSASKDDTRPILTGVYVSIEEKERTVVTTDGFRLSLSQQETEEKEQQLIIPASFIRDVIKNIDIKKTTTYYLEEEKMICVEYKNTKYYSRLIEGTFPQYERVLPTEKEATIEINKEELERNVKIISIFARDYSNVIVFCFEKDKLLLRPKKQGNKENSIEMEAKQKGNEITIAFNYKYILDFLNNTKGEFITIDLLRSDAPVVFKDKKQPHLTHIIMPVRIQE